VILGRVGAALLVLVWPLSGLIGVAIAMVACATPGNGFFTPLTTIRSLFVSLIWGDQWLRLDALVRALRKEIDKESESPGAGDELIGFLCRVEACRGDVTRALQLRMDGGCGILHLALAHSGQGSVPERLGLKLLENMDKKGQMQALDYPDDAEALLNNPMFDACQGDAATQLWVLNILAGLDEPLRTLLIVPMEVCNVALGPLQDNEIFPDNVQKRALELLAGADDAVLRKYDDTLQECDDTLREYDDAPQEDSRFQEQPEQYMNKVNQLRRLGVDSYMGIKKRV
jgi:hypothetical protein